MGARRWDERKLKPEAPEGGLARRLGSPPVLLVRPQPVSGRTRVKRIC
jgi:hypothetical protein